MQLGSPQNLTDKARQKSIEVRIRNARINKNNRKTTILIVKLRKQGVSFNKIAIELNNYNYKTRYDSMFTRTQVKRLYDANR